MNRFQGGYAGRILYVDLTDGTLDNRPLARVFAEKYIGGRGFSSRILLDEVPPEIDPYSPRNVVVIASGALNGLPMPSASRLVTATKSPMTGALGDSNSGGYFAPELKYAGFDAIVIKGASKEPVYLFIKDGQAELRPAQHLWGCKVHETHQKIVAEANDEDTHVLVIGPAGENLVRYACVVTDKESVGGRCGIGAVLGSKRLKAIAVRGTRDVKIADPPRFKKVIDDYLVSIAGEAWTESLRRLGTPFLTEHRQTLGIWGAKNFQSGIVEGGEKISGEVFRKKFLVKPLGCMACFIRCRRYSAITAGDAPFYTKGPEYESIHALGAKPNITNPETILRAHYLCDEYGMDEQSAGSAIAMAMELFERGLLNRSQTDGQELVFGNGEALLYFIDKIASRQGFGDLLAEGTKVMGEKLNADYYAIHVKGLEVDAADPRKQETRALTYCVATRGACHLRGNPYIDEFIKPEEAKAYFGTAAVSDINSLEGKGKMVAWSEDWVTLSDLMGICKFAWYRSRDFSMLVKRGLDMVAEAYQAATGIPMTSQEMYRCGERVYNVEKIFNLRQGFGRTADYPPERFFKEPLPTGPAKGAVLNHENYDRLLNDYYEARGWDPETGVPTPGKLKELGLESDEIE
jgi:aldehyde:ferredoxin oxidoreductase